MTSERQFHEQFSAWLRKHGLPYAHSRMDRPTSQACGDPDFTVFKNGRVAFVEFKMPKGKLSPDQTRRFDELAAAGCTVRICRDIECAINHVETEFGCPDPAPRTESILGQPASGAGRISAELDPDKFYWTTSRDIGPVVVARNLQGQWGFIRRASALDKLNLPILPDTVKW